MSAALFGNFESKASTGVAGWSRRRIAELAERELRASPYLSLSHVSCEYRGGALTLRGYLPSYYLKQIAQAVVAEVDGVEQIDNQIEVFSGRSEPQGIENHWEVRLHARRHPR